MRRLRKWRGEESIEDDLTPYHRLLQEINRRGESLTKETDGRLQEIAASLRESLQKGAASDDLLVEVFALVREASHRVLKMRPFDVQVMAGVA
ncbi:MAG: preprotein translocase subunit SecA, partial [Acidobacteria bacterium]|nr:preprotein translocase subunit SecA [Acidobacteriota bacterium]